MTLIWRYGVNFTNNSIAFNFAPIFIRLKSTNQKYKYKLQANFLYKKAAHKIFWNWLKVSRIYFLQIFGLDLVISKYPYSFVHKLICCHIFKVMWRLARHRQSQTLVVLCILQLLYYDLALGQRQLVKKIMFILEILDQKWP